VRDVLDIQCAEAFDIIVVNAVTYLLEQPLLQRALTSIASALQPGGVYIGYELVFPGSREQQVVETSKGHPQGLRLILRSEDNMRAALADAGFSLVDIEPFDIPIDLPKPDPNDTANDANLVTYTVRDEVTNRRLMFRGALYQPWAHIVARLEG